MYVEGDAQMRQFDDGEGKRQSALSIVQRGFFSPPLLLPCLVCSSVVWRDPADTEVTAGNLEVLKRPDPKPEGSPE